MSLGWSISLIVFFFALGWWAGHTKLKLTLEKKIAEEQLAVKTWWDDFKKKL